MTASPNLQTETRVQATTPAQWASFIGRQPWFAGRIDSPEVFLAETVPCFDDVVVAVVAMEHGGELREFCLPVCVDDAVSDLGRIQGDLADALESVRARRAWLRFALEGVGYEQGERRLEVQRTWKPELPSGLHTHRSDAQERTIIHDEQVELTVFRRFSRSPQPTVELGCFIAEREELAETSPFVGFVRYEDERGLADIAQLELRYPSSTSVWHEAYRALGEHIDGPEQFNEFTTVARRVGADLRDLHGALCSPSTRFGFSPLVVNEDDIAAWRESISAACERGLDRLIATHRSIELPGALEERVRQLCGRSRELHTHINSLFFGLGGAAGQRGRHHGSLDLRKAVRTPTGAYCFRNLGALHAGLRRLDSPLRDLASLLRSLSQLVADHASPDDPAWSSARRWERETRAALLNGYLGDGETVATPWAPPTPQRFLRLLTLFELEAALREFDFDLSQRPACAWIGLQGVLDAVDGRR